MNNNDKLIQNTLNLLELKKLGSTALFKESLKRNFKLSVKRIFFLAFLFILFVYLLLELVFPEKAAISVISDLTVNINTVIIPIFAVIITGYAIFQALANENTITTLLTVTHDNNEKISKFTIYNLYFFGVICSYLVLIVVNFILLFMFKYLPEDWSSPLFTKITNERISAFLIGFYLVIIVNFIIEIKSFVYNLFQVFLTNATESSIARIKNINESTSVDKNEISATTSVKVNKKQRGRSRNRK